MAGLVRKGREVGDGPEAAAVAAASGEVVKRDHCTEMCGHALPRLVKGDEREATLREGMLACRWWNGDARVCWCRLLAAAGAGPYRCSEAGWG